MNTEHTLSDRGLFLPWVLANVLGLALGLGLFGLFAEAVGGEHGTVRSDMGHMAGLTIAGAVIALLPWLVLPRRLGRDGEKSLGTILAPALAFIAVVTLSVALLGVVAGAVISINPANPTEAIPIVSRFFTVVAIGIIAAGLVLRALRGQAGPMSWGVLASSLAYPIGFILGLAALGPPVDFLAGVTLAALVNGVFQWLALRQRVKQAGWWAPAYTLSLGIGAAVALVGAFAFAEVIFPVSFLDTSLGFVVILSLVGTVAGAVGGAISGAVLARLVRQPSPAVSRASAPGQAFDPSRDG
jgi:hypothetical protein